MVAFILALFVGLLLVVLVVTHAAHVERRFDELEDEQQYLREHIERLERLERGRQWFGMGDGPIGEGLIGTGLQSPGRPIDQLPDDAFDETGEL